MKTNMKPMDTAARISALKCMDSPVTNQVLNDMIARYMDDVGCPDGEFEYEVIPSSCYPNKVRIAVHVTGDYCYEWLMNNKKTTISDNVSMYEMKTMVFASHKNTVAEITFYVSCKLPEQDYETLDMLGKVHRNVIPSRVEKSIYCEI